MKVWDSLSTGKQDCSFVVSVVMFVFLRDPSSLWAGQGRRMRYMYTLTVYFTWTHITAYIIHTLLMSAWWRTLLPWDEICIALYPGDVIVSGLISYI
jgi:hypothetical protein